MSSEEISQDLIDKYHQHSEITTNQDELEKTRNEFYYLAEIIFEKWLDERKNPKNLG